MSIYLFYHNVCKCRLLQWRQNAYVLGKGFNYGWGYPQTIKLTPVQCVLITGASLV